MKVAEPALAALLLASLAHDPAGAEPRYSLDGLWSHATITPLERPKAFGDRLEMTPEETARLIAEKVAVAENAKAPSAADTQTKDIPCGLNIETCSLNSFWLPDDVRVLTVRGKPRSSIVVDPPNGQIPELSATGKARKDEVKQRNKLQGYDGPETRPLPERCIVYPQQSGPPLVPAGVNDVFKIVQTPDHVVIVNENIHDARVIEIGGTHPPPQVKQWMGHSVGRWEDGALIVETTNFRQEDIILGMSENLKVVERFERTSKDEIHYEFTIYDPAFVRPWSGQLQFYATPGPLLEFACHEGNRSLGGILGGARVQEAAVKAASSEKAAP